MYVRLYVCIYACMSVCVSDTHANYACVCMRTKNQAIQVCRLSRGLINTILDVSFRNTTKFAKIKMITKTRVLNFRKLDFQIFKKYILFSDKTCSIHSHIEYCILIFFISIDL